jgi:hypothetical protein
MDEFVGEARVDARIEDAPQPVHHQHVPLGAAEIRVIGQPEIEGILVADIDGHQRRAECHRTARQHADAGTALNRIERAGAGIRADADNTGDRFNPDYLA